MSFAGHAWLNEPAQWRLDGDLHVVTDRNTDFWRETHYGFTRDSGHFFGREVVGDFTAQLRVQADFTGQYDQAGIMVRLDATTWIKAGLERSDGRCLLGSVLTLGRSDWATGPFDGNPADIRLRVTLRGGVIRVQASADGLTWPLVRLAPFPLAASCRVGPMCCTPERAGLAVVFSAFEVGPSLARNLHDLS